MSITGESQCAPLCALARIDWLGGVERTPFWRFRTFSLAAASIRLSRAAPVEHDTADFSRTARNYHRDMRVHVTGLRSDL